MRLINAQTLEFEEFFENAIPKYAILSHTWGQEEVSHQQFFQPEPATKLKAGYLKIEQTCKEARNRGLRYVWVDTCCIDKTSSAELSEAINSMFRWYGAAEVCFTYLVDVPPTSNGLYTSFEKSRWFTRGWALQELLAPKALDFFASDWTFMATRNYLANRISRITGIDEVYLTGSPSPRQNDDLLRKANIAEKMSWAAERTTTRKEDIAYSLLGIFGVSMPLIYGEGSRAFLRLQEEIARSAFDPTLLAWNVQHNGQPMLPEEAEPYSRWLSALNFLTAMEHPWSASFQPLSQSPPTGYLAPGPEHFLHCKNIEASKVVLDWNLTSRGLEITLPISENERPYAIIPCQLRNNPWNFLAVPLKHHGSNVYSRSIAPARWVSYQTWHQWPNQRSLFMTKVPLRSGSSNEFHRELWIKKLPETVRLLHAYSTEACTLRGTMIQAQSTSRVYTNGLTRAALVLESKDKHESFAIIIAAFDPDSLSFLSLFKHYDELKCHFVRAPSHDILLSLLKSSLQPDTMPNLIEFQGNMLHTTVARSYHLDQTIFEIDVQQLSPFASLIKRYKYAGAVLGSCETLVGNVLSIKTGIALFVFWLGRIIGMLLLWLECSGHLPRVLSMKIMVDNIILLFGNWACKVVLAYELVPLQSCIAPESSAFYQRNRWALASFWGTALLIITSSGIWNLSLGLVFLWHCCWGVDKIETNTHSAVWVLLGFGVPTFGTFYAGLDLTMNEGCELIHTEITITGILRNGYLETFWKFWNILPLLTVYFVLPGLKRETRLF